MRGLGRPGRRGHRPRGVLRLPGQPAAGRHRRTAVTGGSPGPAPRSRSPSRPDLRPRHHPDARHRAEHEVAAVLRRAARPPATTSAASWWSPSGALLADTPHTRPIPVTGTATEPELVDRLKLEQSTYEGPTGIVGVLPGRLRAARHPGGVLLGGRPALRRPAALPQGHARAARPARGPARDQHPARRPARGRPRLGARRRRAAPRRTRTSPTTSASLEETRDTTELPEASRRGDRPRVRALPQAPAATSDLTGHA